MVNWGSKEGLRQSRKFATGTVHEVGTGKLEVLDRYLEDKVAMLKYKWLTGEFEGQIETNKEVNINASIWKFDKLRGKTDSQQQAKTIEDFFLEISEKLDDIQHNQVEYREHIINAFKTSEHFQERMNAVHDNATNILEHLKEFVDHRKQQDRLIAKLTQDIEEKDKLVRTLMEVQKATQTQVEVLVKNFDLASKLIDKI